MGYSAEVITQTQPKRLEEPVEVEGWPEEILNVSVAIYKSGHACAALNRVDIGNRRAISEKLGCYDGVSVTRVSALSTILAAVTEALGDALLPDC